MTKAIEVPTFTTRIKGVTGEPWTLEISAAKEFFRNMGETNLRADRKVWLGIVEAVRTAIWGALCKCCEAAHHVVQVKFKSVVNKGQEIPLMQPKRENLLWATLSALIVQLEEDSRILNPHPILSLA